MRTPEYVTSANLQTRNCTFSIDKNGMLNGKMETRFEGEQYDNREDLTGEPYQEQLKSLQQIYLIDNLNIKSFNLKQEKTAQPITFETISLEAPYYCTLNDGRFVVPINRVNFIKHPLKEIRNRVLPVCIGHGYVDQDEVVYQLPEDFKIEEKPRNVETKTSFGTFNAKIEMKDGKLVYSRRIQINAGTYPKETYQELADFYQTVYESDNASFTMIKK